MSSPRSGVTHLKSNPIQELRRILRDQYSVGSIVKELVQNADDAGASVVHFGLVHSWPGSAHPLLGGPTLFVLNDGEFRTVDIEGITRLDEGAKGGDAGTIGKYGLGMKSVFHLCEGLFYAASANQPGAEGEPLLNLLNPWEEGGPHDDWNDMGRASASVISAIQAWRHGSPQWFSLVIPLRQSEHLGGAEAIVQGRTPSLDEIRESLDATELAALMPLLRSVGEFHVWTGERPADLSLNATTRVDEGSLQRAYGSKSREIAAGSTVELRLTATLGGAAHDHRFVSAGVERLLEDESLQRLRDNEQWPKNYTWDSEAGRSQLREKGEPHCAVVLSRLPGEGEVLEIHDAVYLPLSDGRRGEVPLSTARASTAASRHLYRLLLHGQFFLDAGRRRLYDGADSDIQTRWNDALLSRGVLPLVPRAVAEFVDAWECPFEEVRAITEAIQSSTFFRERRSEICSERAWLAPLRSDMSAPRWRLVDSSKPFLRFPPLRGREETVAEMFPSLSDISASDLLIESDAPFLSLHPATGWREAPDLLVRLLEDVEPEKLVQPETLQILTDLLELSGRSLPSDVRETLASLLKSTIADLGVPPLLQVADDFRSLLKAAPEESWVGLGPMDTDALPIFRDLNRLDLTKAIVPSQLIQPTEATETNPAMLADTGAVTLEEARVVFEWLDKTSETRQPSRTAAVATRVLEATSGSQSQRQEFLASFSVWLIRSKDGRERLESWARLTELMAGKQIFAAGSALLNALQSALKDNEVYSLYSPQEADLFNDLFGLQAPPTCDVSSCLSLLSRSPAPRLAPPDERVSLLKRLKQSADQRTTRDRAALRYLLHGHPEHARDADTRLISRSAGRTGDHLSNVTAAALRRLEAEWRWVPEALWATLTNQEQESLGVSPVDGSALERLLLEAGTSWIDELGLSDAHATALLNEIGERETWLGLPLHRAISGDRVSLDHCPAYLQSDYGGPEELRRLATIIQTPVDARLREKYRAMEIPEWGPAQAIFLGLPDNGSPAPAASMLEALAELPAKPPDDLDLTRLRKATWLPTIDGRFVAPQDVVVIEGLEDELARLFSDPEIRDSFVSFGDLAEDVRSHPGFGRLKGWKILPDKRKSVEVLALCLESAPRYRVGNLAIVENDAEGLTLLLRAFGGADEALPVIPILRTLDKLFEEDRDHLARSILPAIRGPLPFDVTSECVAALSKAVATWGDGSGRIRVLSEFLKSLFRLSPDPESIRNLQIPNAGGALRAIHQLCASQQGIDPTHLVHPGLVDAVPENRALPVDSGANPEFPQESEATEDSEVLLEYLREWEGLVPDAQLGALLALFGDDMQITETAKPLLSPHSLEGVRTRLEWTPYELNQVNESVHESMAKQRFVFRLTEEGSTQRVPNLLGDWYEAPIGGELESIFVGSLWRTPSRQYLSDDYRVKLVNLRSVSPDSMSRRARSEILRRSVELLLDQVYRQRPTNFQAWWERLSESGQLALEIVQQQLLRHCWFYLQQLGDQRLHSLKDALRRYDELHDREVELGASEVPSATRELQEVRSELEALPSHLRQRLTADAEVQGEILASIRRKMEAYQYSALSVPHELFQNADDAAAELQDMVGPTANLRRVEFRLTTDGLLIRHWGRPINQFSRGGFPPDEGRRRGYDKDLKKMLILASSDKSEREELVTGKFGLGFKSVFFMTDTPEVISGDLAFEVLAGFFPERLSSDRLTALRQHAGRPDRDESGATVINLPLGVEGRTRAAESLTRFTDLLPLSLVFARCIHNCRVTTEEASATASVQETVIAGEPENGVLHCRVASDAQPGELWKHSFLVLRTASERASIAFSLGPRGPRPLPSGTPGIWVGGPMSSPSDIGFSINADFDVDVGRNQLAESDQKNAHMSLRIGAELSDVLCQLFDDSQDQGWEGVRSQLGLLETVGPVDFWTRLWDLASKKAVLDHPLLRTIFWSPERGLLGLARTRCVMPTGLPGAHETLTSLERVQGVVGGILDAEPEVTECVLAWPDAEGRWNPGALVSSRREGELLVIESPEEPEGPVDLRLMDFLRTELSGQLEVSAEQASRFGEALTSARLHEWEQERRFKEEVLDLRRFLSRLQFATESGEASVATDLVAPQLRGDEARRAAFAPDNRVLSDRYDRLGAEFFRACRQELSANVETLTRWARSASDRTRRRNALKYLLEGELATSLAERLRRTGRGTWLEEIPPDVLSGFADFRIHAMLATDRASFDQRHGSSETTYAAAIQSPERALSRIHEWWSRDSADELDAFNAKLYPGGRFLNLSDCAPESKEERKEWLKLFLLGSLQTTGWSNLARDRNFVQLVDGNGLLDAMADDGTEPGAWLTELFGHIDKQESEIKYYRQMQPLLGISVIALNLDEYVELFLAADLLPKNAPATAITRPRTSEFFQGGGPDAPPISEVLGIGQLLIMRELVRHEILSNRHLHQYCFVPSQRVRQLIHRIGGPNLEDLPKRFDQSRTILEFLESHLGENATFDNTFDIPFDVLSQREDLQQELLR